MLLMLLILGDDYWSVVPVRNSGQQRKWVYFHSGSSHLRQYISKRRYRGWRPSDRDPSRCSEKSQIPRRQNKRSHLDKSQIPADDKPAILQILQRDKVRHTSPETTDDFQSLEGTEKQRAHSRYGIYRRLPLSVFRTAQGTVLRVRG